MTTAESSLTETSRTELTTRPTLNSLAQGSMFWQPEYLEASPWLEHLPLLFWLMEALQPSRSVTLGEGGSVAHFAVCQASRRLQLDTQSHLVATAEAFATLSQDESWQTAQDRYAGVSHGVEATPTAALKQFAPGSLDLLLLDVRPDDDSVEYLVDRWASRLSDRGVILLPGIARREPGAELFKAYEALQTSFDTVAFHHGDGLGLIAIGEQRSTLLENLLAIRGAKASELAVRDVFARLGRGCLDHVRARDQQRYTRELERQLEGLRQQHGEWENERAAWQNLQQRFDLQEERHASERGRLAEQVSQAQEKAEAWRRERGSLEAQLTARQSVEHELVAARAAAETEARLATEQCETLKGQLAAEQGEAQSLKEALEGSKADITELQRTLADREALVATRSEELEARTEQFEAVQAEAQRLQTDLDEARQAQACWQQEAEAGQAEVAELKRSLAEKESSVSECLRELLELNEKLNAADAQAMIFQSELMEARQEQNSWQQKAEAASAEEAKLKNLLADKEANMAERFRELAALTERLEAVDAEAKTFQREREEAKQEKAHWKQESESLKAQIAKLKHTLADKEANIAERFRELAVLTERLEAVDAEAKTFQREREEAKQEKAYWKQEAESLNAQIAELKHSLADKEVNIAERFRELAVLTQMLEDRDKQLEAEAPEVVPPDDVQRMDGLGHGSVGSQEKSPTVNVVAINRRPSKRKLKRDATEVAASLLFDASWYLKAYPDIAADTRYSSAPALHYVRFGAFEGRNPGPEFDSAWYLRAYPDVAESGINPLLHYLRYGREEGRLPRPEGEM